MKLMYQRKGRSDPQFGAVLELGFLGYVFTVELPTSSDAQQSSKALRSPEKYDPESHVSSRDLSSRRSYSNLGIDIGVAFSSSSSHHRGFRGSDLSYMVYMGVYSTL